MSQTGKMIVAVIVTAFVAGGGVYFWQQQKISGAQELNQNMQDSPIATDYVPKEIDMVPPTESWFNKHNWTEWYESTTRQGNLAMSYLQKIGASQPLDQAKAKELYYHQGLTAGKDIAIAECPGQAGLQPGRIADENTPGIRAIDIYSTDKNLADGGLHEIYLSDALEQDELQNRWPRLYGPYAENAKDLIDSFAAIDCVSQVPKSSL